MPPDDPTPLGDAMTHRFPDQKIPKPGTDAPGRDSVDAWNGEDGAHTAAAAGEPEVPTPEPVPLNNPDPQPGDGKPKAPPAGDEPGRRVVPVELPGREHAPERASGERPS